MRQQFSESFLSHYYWHKDGDRTPWIPNGPDKVDTVYDGTITTALAGTDLDKNNRTNALVEALAAAKKVIIKPPNGLVSLELRFRFNGTAGDQHVLPIYAAAGVDHYDLVDTLTIDQGSQIFVAGAAGTGIDFCDTIDSAGEKWLTATTYLTSTTNNIGRYVLNTHGYDRILIAASTLDVANSGTTLYVDWKQL